MADAGKIRIDKWLWAVRLYKTRGKANDACVSGKVKIDGSRIKPSRMIQIGDIISVQRSTLKEIFKVTGLIEKRVSAEIAEQNKEDITPPEDRVKLTSVFANPVNTRDRGTGRPTKRERRKMDQRREKF